MKPSILLAYHLLAGLSDFATGALLMIAPVFTLALMRLAVPEDALPFLSFIGAFVMAVGLAYLYGFMLLRRGGCGTRLDALWIVTALLRGSIASYVTFAVLSGALASGWIVIALFDGVCVVIQTVGLRQGWLAHV
jgi:hypothetical protein